MFQNIINLTTKCIYQPANVLFFKLASTYLVVSDSGVKGQYNDLQDAKQELNGINNGNRMIAEVNSAGILNRDPHKINGNDQTLTNGFKKYWCGWSCINRLMDMCQTYLDAPGKRYSS